MSLNENELKALLSEKTQDLKSQLRDSKRQLEIYRKEHGRLENFFDDLKDAISDHVLSPVKVSYKSSFGSKRTSSPCSAVMCINDMHMGAVQHSSEIEGFGKFDPDICVSRCLNYAYDVVEWVELHRNIYNLDEIVVLVLGDLISGDIHDELRKTNAFPTPVQCIEAGKLLANQIIQLVPNFKKVRVEFIVADNHSRLTKKPQCKEEGINSLSYIVGYYAKQLLSSQSNVEFNIYPMYEKVISVINRQYLICHGHGVTGWGGIPWYGIERKVGKESVKRLQDIMRCAERAKVIGFHKYVFGHWHTDISLPLYWGSGSVSGTDAYDHKNGRYGDPSQAAWIVHPKWREINRNDFMMRD